MLRIISYTLLSPFSLLYPSPRQVGTQTLPWHAHLQILSSLLPPLSSSSILTRLVRVASLPLVSSLIHSCTWNFFLLFPLIIFSGKNYFHQKHVTLIIFSLFFFIPVPASASVSSLDFRLSPSLPFPPILKSYGVCVFFSHMRYISASLCLKHVTLFMKH